MTAQDTAAMFWEKVSNSQDREYPLKTLFRSPLGYSYTAFRQATLLYEEVTADGKFDAAYEEVASAVTMHPEFVTLLHLVAAHKHVTIFVLTRGLRRIWEKVLERAGLADTVHVIGVGRIADGFVVTPVVKDAIVTCLQDVHKMYLWAFGDSPVDLHMLSKADKAIIVVGDEQDRSKTMNSTLRYAINNGHHGAC